MKIRLLAFITFLLLIALGCEREQELLLPDSTISVLNYDGSPIIQEPSGEVAIDITSQSLAGVDKVEVLVDNAVVETVQPETDVFTFNYSYLYKIAQNAQIGDQVNILFRMTDKEGRMITSNPVIVRIDQPYRIEDFVSGGNTFRKVTGRINVDFTFTKDQKWLIESVVSVSEGTTLTVKAGTTVYFRTFSNTDKLSKLVIMRGAKIIAEGTDFGTRRGIRIRRGAIGFMHNAIITEFPSDAVRVEDLPIESLGVTTIIADMHAYNNFVNWEQEAKDVFFESGNYNLNETPVAGVDRENFVGTTISPYNPTVMGSWFSSAPFIGAVNAQNDWTIGGNWFRNKDGSLRK